MDLGVAAALRILIGVGLGILCLLVSPKFPAFIDMFRGGPRPPSHPLPADDSRLL